MQVGKLIGPNPKFCKQYIIITCFKEEALQEVLLRTHDRVLISVQRQGRTNGSGQASKQHWKHHPISLIRQESENFFNLFTKCPPSTRGGRRHFLKDVFAKGKWVKDEEYDSSELERYVVTKRIFGNKVICPDEKRAVSKGQNSPAVCRTCNGGHPPVAPQSPPRCCQRPPALHCYRALCHSPPRDLHGHPGHHDPVPGVPLYALPGPTASL